jgi:hypothetical protein
MDEKKELIAITFNEIEEEMRKYNPDFKKLSVKEISSSPDAYQLFSTILDDHFTILLRSADKNDVMKAKVFLSKCGFVTLSSQDTFGLENVQQDYIEKKNLPANVVDATIRKTAEYLSLDIDHIKEIGKNKEGDYYFYFYPIKEDVPTWHEFKKRTYLDELNKLAKASHQSIDLIFAQLDNVVYGGLKLPGIASKEYEEAFFEAVNVQVNKRDKRSLFIACKNLMQLVSEESELSEIGQFQMFMVEEDIFVEEDIPEIYLDFPNEVDEKTFNEL